MVVSDRFIVSTGDNVSSDSTAYTVQDSDCLNGSTGRLFERSGVEGTLSSRSTAIGSVMDFRSRRSGDVYYHSDRLFVFRSDDRRFYRAGLGATLLATGLSVATAGLAAAGAGVATLAAAGIVVIGSVGI